MTELTYLHHWYNGWAQVRIGDLPLKDNSNQLRDEVVNFLLEQSGPRGSGWQNPQEGLVLIKDPRVAMRFKLQWGE